MHGGDDPTWRDLILELEEFRIWYEEEEEEEPPQEDPEQGLWESAARADRTYRAKKTGDSLTDLWEEQLARGEDPDLSMR